MQTQINRAKKEARPPDLTVTHNPVPGTSCVFITQRIKNHSDNGFDGNNRGSLLSETAGVPGKVPMRTFLQRSRGNFHDHL